MVDTKNRVGGLMEIIATRCNGEPCIPLTLGSCQDSPLTSAILATRYKVVGIDW
jgi:hypothetical protein